MSEPNPTLEVDVIAAMREIADELNERARRNEAAAKYSPDEACCAHYRGAMKAFDSAVELIRGIADALSAGHEPTPPTPPTAPTTASVSEEHARRERSRTE